MSILNAIILGIIEGVTEFLPISSTGHLILASGLLKIQQSNFVKSFEIIIQLGAILAVVVLYWRSLITNWEVMKKIAAAFIPTGIIGFILYKVVKHFLLGNTAVVVWSLIIGGAALIVFELIHKEKSDALEDVAKISYPQAVAIGLFQSLGIIPGVSRAAATIAGGLILGLKRKTIVEFSFLLAVPTMLAATGYDLLKSGSSFTGADWLPLFIGFLVSFVVALVSIKWLLNFIKKYSFVGFGAYRIIAAIAFWLIIL